MVKFFKKYHKWLSIVVLLFILLFSLSGIILNHRALFSGFDLSRNLLPSEYSYNDWNNSAVKGTLELSKDSILIYGNIGIWLTDSTFSNFNDFNNGFDVGIDNRKIERIYLTKEGSLFAGTLFGLFRLNRIHSHWEKIELDLHDERITDITEKNDTLLVLSRSYLLKSANQKDFEIITLPKPVDYVNKEGLFKTLWVIHSGEIYGTVGKLLVDAVGLIFIFLCLTGILYFINPYFINRKKKKGRNTDAIVKSSKWNLKWHNKIGWITVLILILTTVTGMFLRPPLLITIAGSKVDKIPYSILDSPNPWFDKLRRVIYDEKKDMYIIGTLDGVYYSTDNLNSKLKKFRSQPSISVMGINVFEQVSEFQILVGSFSGLFIWDFNTGIIHDYISGRRAVDMGGFGPPVGFDVITGYSKDYIGREVVFDFNAGAYLLDRKGPFSTMPPQIKYLPISLWNTALEFHTARIYQSIIGDFYILIIPLIGIIIIFIQVSGFIVWYAKHRKSKKAKVKKPDKNIRL